ncbi:PIG-L family deacetylase [Erysipelotrichaceae bacterium AF15-26LB]|jgi:LmbE family N-acetylglucosaminyl deacetylase|nr:PIG-L family deacetylase [[Clostridium] innocuum]RJV83494.1 PIG-L family deacetylase [Erysipelotrichaceae bacterium AF15-26LB]RJV84841.1 PIG-L family deacetylase [Erysipelotrichaceae bacterium AF19-24AC]
MNIAILCPHQDDEILSSFYLISRLRARGHTVHVIFATNGDYRGTEIARIRYFESKNALALCNIDHQHIHYMGYADTGMCLAHSFLYRLYNTVNNEVLPSQYKRYTYHPAQGNTVHKLLFHKEAAYTRNNFISDLSGILQYIKPDLIISPSPYDAHGDHRALWQFMNMIPTTTPILTYLIHAGEDEKWPGRAVNIWTRPPCIPEKLWKYRITCRMCNPELKKNAILCFASQNPYADNSFLLSFVKEDEFFLLSHHKDIFS